MRYYTFNLHLRYEDITSSKVKLREYSYENSIEAVTNYLSKNLSNGISFLIYRDEGTYLRAVYAIDEKTRKPDEVMDEIMSTIEDILDRKIKTSDFAEITMIEFESNLREAKRRGLCQYWSRLVDQANVILYDERELLSTDKCGFRLAEDIAYTGPDTEDHLFDATLRDELDRIARDAISDKDSTNTLTGIAAHYVISSRSKEAGSDITIRLMGALAKAGRLKGGRMELITDIDDELYRHPSIFEKIIENSYGGTIVIDMSTRLGVEPTAYATTCEYFARLVKTHKNDNLFVFLYDIDNLGFAFTLIPLIEKYIYYVPIREGKGSRADAESYLKNLISASEYSSYVSQAGEYLDTLDGTEFTQTDILKAFDSFESWCIRKNFLKSYKLQANPSFKLDRDDNTGSAYDRLQSLIGLKAVKEQIDMILLANKAEQQRKKHSGNARSMHMTFKGNPGAAKTLVAQIFAKIAKESGLLQSGIFIERSGTELNFPSEIEQAFELAKGGVLFIDEAYALFGQMAITELIRHLEMYRNDVIVIFAGYKDRMDAFLEQNEGLKSRIPYTVDFPDYTPEELLQIYDYILAEDGFTATPGARQAALDIFNKAYRLENFGNGRFARNLAEKSTLNMSVRLARKYKDKKIPENRLYKVTKEDVYIPNDPIVNGSDAERNDDSKMSARERLENMIGLSAAKSLIEAAIASFKFQKRLSKRGVNIGRNSMHMCFTGNPGTGKTEIARLLAQILKEEGVLSSGKFVEAGRADLVGQYVGHTAPKVRKKFKEAMGGVLFIDEAYSLDDGNSKGSFGDEAINTIVQEMDNRREDIIVIFAGYPDEMKNFIDRNPGMSSRIAHRIHFEDYSVDELCEITRFQIADKHLKITDEAIDKLALIYEIARVNKTFGNGRYVRRAIELAISNLAVRLDKMPEEDLTDEILTTITAEDIAAPELDPDTAKKSRKIGFAA